jgi:hypothetical protein
MFRKFDKEEAPLVRAAAQDSTDPLEPALSWTYVNTSSLLPETG